MKQKTILLDMDGILADLHLGLIRWYNQLYGTKFRPKQIPNLFGDHQLLTTEIDERKRDKIFSKQGFFGALPPIPGAKEAVRELNKYYNIYIVTAPWINRHCWIEKYQWLQKHFPGLERKLIVTSRKETVYGHILVDDRMKNVELWRNHWPTHKTASLEYHWTDPSLVDIIEPNWRLLSTRLIKEKDSLI